MNLTAILSTIYEQAFACNFVLFFKLLFITVLLFELKKNVSQSEVNLLKLNIVFQMSFVFFPNLKDPTWDGEIFDALLICLACSFSKYNTYNIVLQKNIFFKIIEKYKMWHPKKKMTVYISKYFYFDVKKNCIKVFPLEHHKYKNNEINFGLCCLRIKTKTNKL